MEKMKGYLLNETTPEKWPNYFGNQKRFTPFIIEMLHGIGWDSSKVFGETNSGSHAISSAVREEFACTTLSNDISMYSRAIGLSLNGQGNWITPALNVENESGKNAFLDWANLRATQITTSQEAAAMGCVMLEFGGYDLDFDIAHKTLEWDMSFSSWHLYFIEVGQMVGASIFYTLDLFEFLKTTKGDLVYMDFAWPWKDGSDCEEYGDMIDVISSTLTQSSTKWPKLWNKQNVVNNVLKAVKLGLINYEYVLLSNQSSNYPTPDILEPALLAEKGLEIICMRRLTMPAEDVDNRGIDEYFTEYQYLIKLK